MAFFQGSASSPDDALLQVVTFLQSNGYTAIRTRTEDTNGTDVLTYTLQCPDGTYITFLSTDGLERPYHPTTNDYDDYYKSPFIGTNFGNRYYPVQDAWHGRSTQKHGATPEYARPWLGCIRHLTYDVSKDWYDQPDAKRVYETVSDTYYSSAENKNSYSAMPIGYTTPNLYIFVNTNPDCIHLVSEYEDNEYGHMTIGNLDKSHDYVGGQYIVGSCLPVDGRGGYCGYFPYSMYEIEGFSGTKQFSGAVYCEGDGTSWYTEDNYLGMKGWGRVQCQTGISIPYSGTGLLDWYSGEIDSASSAWSNNTLGIPCAQGFLTGYTNDFAAAIADGNNPLGSTFDLQTGQSAPIPLTAWCEHEITGAVYLGSYVHVGVIMMSAFRGKEEFTLGGDTYQVFPLSSLVAGATDGTQWYPYYSGTTSKGTYAQPYGALCMLGLAIKKVI